MSCGCDVAGVKCAHGEGWGCRGGGASGTHPAALLGRNLLVPACCTLGKVLLGAAS